MQGPSQDQKLRQCLFCLNIILMVSTTSIGEKWTSFKNITSSHGSMFVFITYNAKVGAAFRHYVLFQNQGHFSTSFHENDLLDRNVPIC